MIINTINGLDVVVTKTRKYFVYKDHLFFISLSGRVDEVIMPYGEAYRTYFYALTVREKSGNIK